MFKNFVLHRSWLVVGVMLALVLFVRLRLREMPLERDEGEYAYAGQLMLQGIPPYKLAYNMKLPGTYAAYAVIMAVFGQTPAGIHTGLALVNCASIILVYLIGRKLLDETTGLVAAIAFGLMSLSPSVFGLAAHATHFVTFFALAGTLALMRSVKCQVAGGTAGEDSNAKNAKGAENRKEDSASSVNSCENPAPKTRASTIFYLRSPIFYIAASGAMYGLAFLMKQHGVFFGIFGFVYLAFSQWSVVRGPSSPRRRSASRLTHLSRRRAAKADHAPRSTIHYPQFTIHSVVFAIAFLSPYALTCLWLWASGVFPQFWFWTVSYASKYATAVPVIYGGNALKTALDVVIGPYTFFWLLAAAGAVWMWWDERFAEASVQSSVFSLQSSKAELPQKGAKEQEKRRSQLNAESAKGAEKRRETPQLSTANPQPPEQPQTPMNRERVNADERTIETAEYAKYAKAESTGIQPPSTTPDSALGSRITHHASRKAPEHAESSKIAQPRIMLAMFTVCSFASVSVGFHYRNHYFITLLPAIGLLAGVAVSRAIYLLPRTKSLDLFLALPVPLVALGGVIWSLAGDGALWFATPVSQADVAVYKTTAFREAAEIAKFIRENVAETTKPQTGETAKYTKYAKTGVEPQERDHASLITHQRQPQMDADKRRSDTRHLTPDTQLFNAKTAKGAEKREDETTRPQTTGQQTNTDSTEGNEGNGVEPRMNTHEHGSETAKYAKYTEGPQNGTISHEDKTARPRTTGQQTKTDSTGGNEGNGAELRMRTDEHGSETAKYAKYTKGPQNGTISREEEPANHVSRVTHLSRRSAAKADHASNPRIAVIGSEPEIYFLARLPSATGYIYTFPLMEYHSMAETMQRQMIAEIETNKPGYVIYVADDLSWLRRPDSLHLIDDWWKGYWDKNLELVDTITIKEQKAANIMDQTVGVTPATNPDGSPKCFLVLKRK